MTTTNQETLFEIRVRVPREHVDAVSDFIVDRINAGLVHEDIEGCDEMKVLFYATPDLAEVQVVMVKDYLIRLFGSQIDPSALVTVTEIENRAWEEEYRRSVQVVVVDDVVVVPPWATAPIETPYEIVIEPKMAFGTGTHETTRSCLKAIRKDFLGGMRFLDLGCGSGILSILADRMGAAYIKAIDYDVTAIDNCRENFVRNAVSTPHDIVFGSVEKCRGDERYQFIVANIIKSTIMEMLPRLVELTARPGRLVLSGLLDQDVPDVEAVLDRLGATERTVFPDNEWRTITTTLS